MSDPWRPAAGPTSVRQRPVPRWVWPLLACGVFVAIQLPGAIVWAVEVATRATPELGFPGWTPPSTAWAYDSWVWSTTALAALLAGLVTRRPAAAVVGTGAAVLLGVLRYPFLAVVGLADAFDTAQVVLGLVIALAVALPLAAVAALAGRRWWGRLVVLAACLPALFDQTRLVDVLHFAVGRPNPTLPPSATWITPAFVAVGVVAVLACSGLSYFGGRTRWPLSLAVAAGSVLVALLVLAPARFLLLDAAQAVLPRAFGGGTLRFAGVPWTFVPSLLGRYWWMFLLAVAIGAGLSALLRLAEQSLLADEGQMGVSAGPQAGRSPSA